jgi:hypothetical protein
MKNKLSFIAVPFQKNPESLVIHYVLTIGVLISIIYRYDGELLNVKIRYDTNAIK